MTEPSPEAPDRKRDRSAVVASYQVHLDALKRFIGRIIGRHPHDVDDVVQEAFLRAYCAENGKAIEQPKSYLFRTARHIALNKLRERSRRPTDYLDDIEPAGVPCGDWTLEDEIMAQQKLEIHCAAVAALPPTCRKVYLMRKVYGMPYKEIAQALGITVSTVESHLEKAFARCTDYVEERLGETGGRSNGNAAGKRRP